MQKLKRELNPLFDNLKEVNEDKTGLIVIGDRKARRRMVINGGSLELTLAGKRIKIEERKKSLGLLVSNNLNWTDHVNFFFCTILFRDPRSQRGRPPLTSSRRQHAN